MLFKDLMVGQKFLISYEVKESQNKKSATWLPVLFWYRKMGTNAYERDSVFRLLKPDHRVYWRSKFVGVIYEGAEVQLHA